MKIRFTKVICSENWDFRRIIRDAGYSHEVDVEKVIDAIWDGGSRHITLYCELDSETGVITVVGQEAA